jgi:hypothetical protein
MHSHVTLKAVHLQGSEASERKPKKPEEEQAEITQKLLDIRNKVLKDPSKYSEQGIHDMIKGIPGGGALASAFAAARRPEVKAKFLKAYQEMSKDPELAEAMKAVQMGKMISVDEYALRIAGSRA